MIGKKTLETEPIPAAKVKEILEEFSEKHEGLKHFKNQKIIIFDTAGRLESFFLFKTLKIASKSSRVIPSSLISS